MKNVKVTFEPHAHLDGNEKVLLNWLVDNIDGCFIVVAESQQSGLKKPDILCNHQPIELKTTSGNLATLDSLLRKAAKQAPDGCAIVNLVQVSYSLREACEVALQRMKRSKLSEVYLLVDGIAQAHLFQNKEETYEIKKSNSCY